MKSIKTLLQMLFGYRLLACYGRVEQYKTFWTLADAMRWMALYPRGSTVVIVKRNTMVCGRRAVVGIK
jgi:hypothetical protein